MLGFSGMLSALRKHPPAIGSCVPRLGPAERMPDSRRASHAGPRAHLYHHTPEASGRLGDRLSEREERYCHRQDVRQGEKLFRRALLGPRLCGVHVGFELEQVRKYIREQELADGNPGQF